MRIVPIFEYIAILTLLAGLTLVPYGSMSWSTILLTSVKYGGPTLIALNFGIIYYMHRTLDEVGSKIWHWCINPDASQTRLLTIGIVISSTLFLAYIPSLESEDKFAFIVVSAVGFLILISATVLRVYEIKKFMEHEKKLCTRCTNQSRYFCEQKC